MYIEMTEAHALQLEAAEAQRLRDQSAAAAKVAEIEFQLAQIQASLNTTAEALAQEKALAQQLTQEKEALTTLLQARDSELERLMREKLEAARIAAQQLQDANDALAQERLSKAAALAAAQEALRAKEAEIVNLQLKAGSLQNQTDEYAAVVQRQQALLAAVTADRAALQLQLAQNTEYISRLETQLRETSKLASEAYASYQAHLEQMQAAHVKEMAAMQAQHEASMQAIIKQHLLDVGFYGFILFYFGGARAFFSVSSRPCVCKSEGVWVSARERRI